MYEIGKTYVGKNGDEFKVLGTVDTNSNYKRIVVEFKGYEQYPQVVPACSKNPKNSYKPTCYGVGYVGDLKSDVPFHKEISQRWRAMLSRCYNKNHCAYPSYGGKGIKVCDEWLNFSNYYRWFITEMKRCNYSEPATSIHVDKDFMVPGSKIYSPTTCILLPVDINHFISRRTENSDTGFVGIGYMKNIKSKPYYFNKSKTGESKLVFFATPEEAFEEYKLYFNKRREELLEEYKDNLTPEVTKRLEEIDIEYLVH